MPKTRSGKILRGTVRKIADKEEYKMPATIDDPAILDEIKQDLQFGASPRATIDMFKVVKAKAYLRGNDYVSPVDVALSFKDVLRHRIILSYEAEALGINSDDILQKVIEKVQIP